jgi:zinc protease
MFRAQPVRPFSAPILSAATLAALAASGSAASGSAASGSAASGSAVSGSAVSSSAVSGSAVSGSAVSGSAAPAQDVAYEKFELDNGLTVILHEDHSAPIATVNLWYGVGSKDEPRDRTGFAHLFEHLMFMGTARVPGSGFDDLMEAGGGWNNASTSPDRTNYYSVGPVELLPTLLWLDADRLETLGRDMTQEKLESQRAVVLNEYRQSYENSPYGVAFLASNPLLYPSDHPYHVSTIGYMEHIRAATLGDVQEFFAKWYVPNNASLVVAGDFDPQQVRPLVEQLFGTLPRGNDPVRPAPPPDWRAVRERLGREVRHTVVDTVALPMVWLEWHSPALYTPGDAELDLAAGVLADGPSSRLYRRLVVEEGLAVEVDAGQASGAYGSTFSVQVLTQPQADLERVVAVIDEELARFAAEGPSEAELAQRRAGIERRVLEGLQSLQNKADQLNAYQHHFGEPDSFARDLDRYRQATPAGVRSTVAEVLLHPFRLHQTVLPRSEPAAGDPRGAAPEPLAGAGYQVPEPTAFELGNGITGLHWQRPELPLCAVRVLLSGGADADGEQAGRTALALDLLDEGAGERSAEQFAAALEALGAEFSATAGEATSVVGLDVLARNLEPAAALLGEALYAPRFDPAEFERVRRLAVAALEQELDEPGAVAARVARRLVFGAGHPLQFPPAGLRTTVAELTLESARRRHAELVRPSRMTLFTAGSPSAEQMRAALEAALGRHGETRDLPPPPPEWSAPAPRALQLAVVDRPGATQTAVLLWLHAPAFAAPERPALELVGTLLGGTFTSRLNANLREDKGWTYGARARYDFEPRYGRLVASTSVQVDATGPAVRELLGEVDRLRGGDAADTEARKSANSLRQRSVERLGSLSGLLAAALERHRAGSSLADLRSALDFWARSGSAEVLNQTARQTLDRSQGVLVLVGDRAAIEAQLAEERAAGLVLPPSIPCDAEGSVLAPEDRGSAKQ